MKVDVTITGDGLVNPVRDSIPRPQNQTVVSKVYTLPVGFKRVTAEAKDNNNQTVASGTGTTTLSEGQRSNLEIVMSEITVRTVLVRTFRNNQPTPADFVAFQDGDRPWQVAQGTGGQYTLNVTDNAGRYGVAIVCVNNTTDVNVTIYHATTDELSEINHECEAPPPQNLVTVSGTVSGLGGNEVANISLDGGFGFAYSGVPYSLQVPPGTYDLIATKGTFAQEGLSINKVFIRCDVAVTSDTTINIDFNSPDAFDPETRNAVINGVASGEEFGGRVTFLSNRETSALMGMTTGTANTFQFAGIPTNRQVGNDIYHLSATSLSSTDSRYINRFFKAPADLSIVLPPHFGNATVTVAATTPYTRFTASWSVYPDAQAYVLDFGGATGRRTLLRPAAVPSRRSRQEVSERNWFVGLSVGWLGGQSGYTLPDFSGLSGWNNAWGFQAGSGEVSWEVGAIASNRTLADIVAAFEQERPVDGLETRQAGKFGTIAP